MKKVLQIISLLALLITVAPSIVFLGGSMDLDRVKLVMLIASLVWFIVTPCWMGREQS